MKKLLLTVTLAVIAVLAGYSAELTDVLTNANAVGNTNTSYATYTVTGTSGAEYNLQCAGGFGTIQLRSSNSNSGIVVTNSPGKVKSISVTFNTENTATNRTVDVYASNKAFTAPTELYNVTSASGISKVTSFAYTDVETNTFSYTFEGDYEFVGIRSNNNALYLASVTIVWETGSVESNVATPAITMEKGDYCYLAKITCATEGAAIYYTTDGQTPTASSTAYTAPVELWGKTTVKAVAIKGGESSAVASATLDAPLMLDGFNSLGELPTGTKVEISGKMTGLFQNDPYTMVSDGLVNMLVYGYNQTKVNPGDTFTSLEGTYSPYNKQPEITNPVYGAITTGGEAPEVLPFFVDDVVLPNLYKQIKLENVTISDINAKNFKITGKTEEGSGVEATIAGYNQFNLSDLLSEELYGKALTVYGFVGRYNDNVQFWAYQIEDYVAPKDPNAPEVVSGTATYAVKVDETHTAGETVDVKNTEGEVVATLTFGFEGGADFKAGKSDSALKSDGFVAYTEGNGENGKADSGTTYIIKPQYAGSIQVGVVLNADKEFYVLEDGTALDGFNGLKEAAKVYKTYTFDVTGGKTYSVYCTGSKLGFYGFNYTYEDVLAPEVEAPAAPVFKPEDGATVAKLQNIEITAEEGCDIYWMIKGWYEEDGFLKLSAPDAFDETAVPLNYTGSTITYVAYAEKDGVKSEEATATYTIGKNAPTFFWSVEETGAPVEEWTYNLNDEEATLPLLIGDLGEAEVTVESSNEAVAVFDVENWTINVKAAGETTLTATLPETTMYTAATATLKLTVTESSIETGEHTYDFTKWSDATIAALAAANDVWSDDEKGDGTNVTDGNCYWLVKGADNNSGKNRDLEDAVDEDGNLLANGEVIEELKGLDFSVIGKKRSLAIAVNYPSTSLGNYEGGSYLWLGGKDINYFVIKDVKAGSFVKMGVESHKTEEARGVELSVYDETADNLRGEKLLGADGKEVAAPTVFEEQVWQVPGEEGTVDILVYNTNGCHIYYIDLADDAEVTTEPEAVLATAEVENVTDTTADIVATFTTANLPEGAKVKVIATEAETRTNTEVEAGEGTATIALTGLTAETEYNYMVVVQVDDAEGNILVRSNIVYLTFTTTASGITGINADAEGVRYFNINGVEVKNPAAGSVYLKVTGNKVEKVLVK